MFANNPVLSTKQTNIRCQGSERSLSVTSVSRPQKSVVVDRKAARASVQRGKPQKPMDTVSLYITSMCYGTHTHSLPHPHHTQRFVLTNRLKKTNTFSLHNISQVCTLNKDREKKDTRKRKCILKSEWKKDLMNETWPLFFISLLFWLNSFQYWAVN